MIPAAAATWLLIVCPYHSACTSQSGIAMAMVTEAQCRAVVGMPRGPLARCVSPDGVVFESKR